MIRALLFDLGNVLVNFSHERMCRQIGELVGWSTEQTQDALMASGLMARYESGELSTDEVVIQFNNRLPRPVSREQLELAACDIFTRNQSIEPVIARLTATGLPLVLVSNTNDAHIRWVTSRFAVLEHFCRRVLSFEVRTCKPDWKIYEAATRLAGVQPSECFFTDDTPGHIESAIRFGFDAVVYRDAFKLVADLKTRGIELDTQLT